MKHIARLVTLVCLVLPISANAQWRPEGTAVAPSHGIQDVPAIVADGTGGSIVVFADYRSGTSDIYAQRLDASGKPQWALDGAPVCTVYGSQTDPRVVSDGAGGAIVVWSDQRFGAAAVYAQHLDASGATQWATGGIPVSENQAVFQSSIISDGQNGAIVAWQSYATFAQRIDALGNLTWDPNPFSPTGVQITTTSADQMRMTSDGANGAILTWIDFRSGETDIYARRINASGVPQWTDNGVALCTAPDYQQSPAIVADGSGGAIVAWQDPRGGGVSDIYAQRVDGEGTVRWHTNGEVVCNSANSQTFPLITTDGAGGAIVSWQDDRVGTARIYAQRINATGNVAWPTNGVMLYSNFTFPPRAMMSDGQGGAVATWNDSRGIYAQRVNNVGTPMWATDGVAINTVSSEIESIVMTAQDNGDALIAWTGVIENDTPQFTLQAYAQNLDTRFGYWGRPAPILDVARDVPGDQGGKVQLAWKASTRDAMDQQLISHYSIWRSIDQMAFQAANTAGAHGVALSDVGPKFAGKAVRKESLAGIDYYWELIGTQQATYRSGYAFTAATTVDSTAATPAPTHFQIVAHANNSQYLNWPSNVAAARSVDNVAPPAPLYLTAQRVGNWVHLKWNGVHVRDLGKYTVFRATSSGVTPIPANYLADAGDTLLTDKTPPSGAAYYTVVASDIHQNRSTKSNEAAVSASTGVGNLPPVAALTVLQNYPNPFTDETQLNVGLPTRGDVHLEIYDVAGKRVRNVLVPAQEKGWNTLRVLARDDRGAALPSGVYFYRVHAGNETVTKKMVIAR